MGGTKQGGARRNHSFAAVAPRFRHRSSRCLLNIPVVEWLSLAQVAMTAQAYVLSNTGSTAVLADPFIDGGRLHDD